MSEDTTSAPTNGTVETVAITLPKFRTLDGRGTCGLDWAMDDLVCPFARSFAFGRKYTCAWTEDRIYSDNPDGTGYLRPCKTCPIHNHE